MTTTNMIRIWVFVIVGSCIGFVYLVYAAIAGALFWMVEPSDQQIAIDLAYYEYRLENASGAGCAMSIEEFRNFHELRAMQAARAKD